MAVDQAIQVIGVAAVFVAGAMPTYVRYRSANRSGTTRGGVSKARPRNPSRRANRRRSSKTGAHGRLSLYLATSLVG